MFDTTATPATTPPPDVLRQVPICEDVVQFTLRCVLALAPELSAAIVKAADAKAREHFGGDSVWVGRRRDLAERNALIRRDFERGERVALLSRRYQLSPVQVWRILNRVPNH